jgi:NH3-dependent NAD+ synthetase
MLDEHARIIKEFGFVREFDAEADCLSAFLADYVQASLMRTLVLGISGGADSLTAGMIAQRAVGRLRDGRHLGLSVEPLRRPNQGLQRTIDYFELGSSL